ncbi:peroxiredoxin Q/BCP [Sulfuritortus calidifontis]|uniref:thioredoxin-dependent peroxiredoxin n=1 Tax=Sulfuritortus calidifontis TaxID=1914471 RepID=A0A4R3JX56_9PROT|nr:peroxiredoxin [Sulfuritortus calidifontis]TCS72895.1 peroxiredoxin Q/BCP [Sulfuritortus calidifontis]
MTKQTIPDFELPGTSGKTFRLADYRGKPLVLYFYPKDNTPGCTSEGRDFSQLYPQFQAVGCEVFGISRDSVKSHEGFKAKHDLAFDLLSDAEEKACQLFDVIKLKNMYGKQVRGIERSTFVIDGKSRLIQAWRGVKVPGHAQAVLDFVQSL